MKTLIFVPTKGPHRRRFGPEKWHDWKMQCVKAAKLQHELQDAIVYVPSAVHINGSVSEYEYYRREMENNGLFELRNDKGDKPTIIFDRQGQETIEQLRLALTIREILGDDTKLIVLSTFPHYLRLLYLCRGKEIMHEIAWGIPNFVEACTDMSLAVLFPILDFLGLRGRFQQWVIKRRESGKHI